MARQGCKAALGGLRDIGAPYTSAERLPAEKAITENMCRFKGLVPFVPAKSAD